MIRIRYDVSDQQNEIKREVEEALKLWDTHGDGKWNKKLLIKDPSGCSLHSR